MLRQDGPDVAYYASSSPNDYTSYDEELLEANQHEYLYVDAIACSVPILTTF